MHLSFRANQRQLQQTDRAPDHRHRAPSAQRAPNLSFPFLLPLPTAGRHGRPAAAAHDGPAIHQHHPDERRHAEPAGRSHWHRRSQ